MATPAPAPATALAALPVINIAPWLDTSDGGHGRLSAAAALHAACLEYGFFYLDISSFVDPTEPEELTRLAREFFERPQAEKDAIGLRHQDGARGYQRLKENVTNGKADNHEGIDFYKPVDDPDKSKTLWGENQWPDQIPGFREKYEAWIAKMKKLGMVVMEAMAAGLGMTSNEWAELQAQVDDSFWVMRVIGYPPLPNDHDGFSCGAHKDYGCLTFLYQDPTRSALQVFLPNPELVVPSGSSKRGTNDKPDISPEPEEGLQQGVWINADPMPNCVVCNIGEMWEIWTNGLYKSTLHRVIHRGSNYRVSIPFFFEPNFSAHVTPLPAALRIQADSTPPEQLAGAHTKTHSHAHYMYMSRRESVSGSRERLAPITGAAQLASGTDGESAIEPEGGLKPSEKAAVVAKAYEPIVYGDFLLRKVGGNFAKDVDGATRERY